MKIKYLGHSAFMIESSEGTILIDPFITGNPSATCEVRDLKPDGILVTHGHGDHIGDAINISKETGALIVAPFELATLVQKKGANSHPMHIGGGRKFPFGYVKLTQAFHGSGFDDEGSMVYTGQPCGFLIHVEGKWIYHAGDTALFGDMKLIGDRFPLDLALLPIGDNFTMGPEDAAYATKLLRPKVVIPMHYDTWEVIAQDPEAFSTMVDQAVTKVEIINPGEDYSLNF
ncbi:metal-dependent hydrolase [bacterium]|nr:metal-dependent hydrolase [bacterium]